MKIIQRLKNIWKLGENKHIPFANIDLLPTSELPKKPQAQIIKRKMSLEDEVNNILKDENSTI